MSSPSTSWFGHPHQLARLACSEMWERFGYYGVRALLALYLTQHFLFADAAASGLYGAFTSLIYVTPLFGGLIADRILGSKRAAKFGAILMACGYLCLCFGGEQAKPYLEYRGSRSAVEQVTSGGSVSQVVVTDQGRYPIRGNADGSLTLVGSNGGDLPTTLAKGSYRLDGERDSFWVAVMLLGLAAIAVGNGLFKPNISTMVGTLYAPGDSRRDAGFTIFYLGINVGSLMSQFFCPLFATWFGWWAGFLLAAGGMTLAWALFHFEGGRLAGYGEPPADRVGANTLLVYVSAILVIPLLWLLLNNAVANAVAGATAARAGSGIAGYLASMPMLGKVLFTLFVAAIVGIPIWAWRAGTREEFHKMVVLIVLTMFSVVFWTFFEQAGSSLTFFADRNVDREILGLYTMPAGQVQIFNPLFILILAPFFSILWVWAARRGWEPSIPVKFAIGLLLMGTGFLALVFGTGFAGADFRVPLFWLVLAYLFHTIGELCLSPVGLSMITKLAIARVAGLMMGAWFLANSMALYVGGIVAQFASVETVGGAATNLGVALDTYVRVFGTIGGWALGVGLVLLLISPWLNRWSHGVR